MIENGGCLPPLLSSVSLPAGEESNKEAVRFPYHGTARRCFPAGCLPDVYALRIIPYLVFPVYRCFSRIYATDKEIKPINLHVGRILHQVCTRFLLPRCHISMSVYRQAFPCRSRTIPLQAHHLLRPPI